MNWLPHIEFESSTFTMVVLIDIVLSGDNAIVIGMAAAGLAPALRQRAIVFGILAAVVLRIAFAMLTYFLLKITGLKLLGGFLLFIVCYQMWRDLFAAAQEELQKHLDESQPVAVTADGHEFGGGEGLLSARFLRAMVTIVVADVSMSLDNVLAVAGIARENLPMLVFGLGLSIALMAVGATIVARLLDRHRWLAYGGLAAIAWVAGRMTIEGAGEVWPYLSA